MGFELTSNLVQSFIFTWFISSFFGYKLSGMIKNWGFLITSIIIFFTISYLNSIIPYDGILACIYILIYVLYAEIFLKGSLPHHIFISVFIFSIVFTTSGIFLFLGTYISGGTLVEFITTQSLLRIVLITMLRVLEYVIFKSVIKINSSYSLTIKEWALFVTLPLMTWIMMITLTSAAMTSGKILNYMLRASILMVAINVILCFFMLKIKQDSETKLNYELLKMQYNNIRSTEANMKALYESTYSLKHDLDKHLFALKEMAKNNNCDDITNYVDKVIDSANDSTQKIVFTGNDIFNAIVNAKLELCKQEGITVNIRVDKEAATFLNTETIVVVLGNVLDNAVEAAKNTEDKIINFFVKLKQEYVSVYVENSFNKNYSNTNLKTTKQKSEEHGFGVKNVKKAVERNGGMVDFYEDENEMFCCDILLKKQ